jgi:hypothetical protein
VHTVPARFAAQCTATLEFFPLRWSPVADFVFCGGCTIGTRSSIDHTQCIPCSAGNYQGDEAQPSCKTCDSGKFAQFEGQTQCNPCPVGQFALGQGSQSCSPCDIGSVSGALGAVECTLCQEGKFNAVPGQSACTLCAAGYFSVNQTLFVNDTSTNLLVDSGIPIGNAECDLCDLGSFTSSLGSTQCTSPVRWDTSAIRMGCNHRRLVLLELSAVLQARRTVLPVLWGAVVPMSDRALVWNVR